MQKFLFILFLLLITSNKSFGQLLKGREADKTVQGAKEVLVDKSKKIKFIRFDDSKKQKHSTDLSLVKLLSLPKTHGFKEVKKVEDLHNTKHIRHQQIYNGIPVEGRVFITHYKNGNLKSANGNYEQNIEANTRPSLSKKEALKKALDYFNAQKYITNINSDNLKGELVILPVQNACFLCYKFDLYASKPLKREYVFVDANTGEIRGRHNRIHHEDRKGTAVTQYNGIKEITADSVDNYYRLRESGRGGGIVTLNVNYSVDKENATDFTDDDNHWEDPTGKDAHAYGCHYNTEVTYDYYLEKFGRNSYDGNGAQLISYIHYGEEYNNAFWDGESMTYGDGDGTRYGPFTCLDVVAHELTHGVTEYTAGLIYSNESGALNESFSDIFGVCVDFYANPSTANYLMGDEFTLLTDGFRDMSNPNRKADPDTYKGRYWFTGTDDYGGVHTNSSVQNYWFFLLAEGGTGINDYNNSYNVRGIGIEKAAQIAYRNLSVYLTPVSNYEEARFYSIQSAIDLYGECSKEAISVANAWYAVGVGELPNTTVASFALETNYSCISPVSIQFTNQSKNASSWQWYFGDGTTSTEEHPLHEYTTPGKYTVKLKVDGNGDCATEDSISLEEVLFIDNLGGPNLIACNPITAKPGEFGIYLFSLQEIYQLSSGASEGNVDNSCNKMASITEGEEYQIIVKTNPTVNENVKIWIDLNNDGVLDDEKELIFSSKDKLEVHKQKVIIPKASIYDIPLRMRVASDIYFKEILPCQDLAYGQYEDYSVIISRNENAPIAQMKIPVNTVRVGETLQFFDLSTNGVSTRKWQFDGGVATNNSTPNPEVTYNTAGKYGIGLIVENDYGKDTVEYSDTIYVYDDYRLGEVEYTQSPNGVIYDPEGANDTTKYFYFGRFVIDVPCADSIIVYLDSIYLGNDGRIFLHEDINIDEWDFGFEATRIEAEKFPAKPFISTSGGVKMEIIANDTILGSDFKIRWKSITAKDKPTVDFVSSEASPSLNSQVSFTDKSINSLRNYYWEFGDGTIKHEKNPIHSFRKSGEIVVTEYVSNCRGTSSLTKVLNVQPPSKINVENDTIQVFIEPNTTKSITKEISNKNGFGDLVIKSFIEEEIRNTEEKYRNTNHTNDLNGVNVLITHRFFEKPAEFIRSMGANVYHNYPSEDVIVAKYIPEEVLDTIDVIVMGGWWCDMDQFDLGILKNWLKKGGGLMVNYPAIDAFDEMNELLKPAGLQFTHFGLPGERTSNISHHQITRDIESYHIMDSYLAPGITISYLSVFGNATSLIHFATGTPHVACSNLEKGKIIAAGDEDFEYRFNSGGHAKLIKNGVKWLANKTDWFSINNDEMIVPKGESREVGLNFSSHNLELGNYFGKLQLQNNDTSNSLVEIPIKLIVSNNVGIHEAHKGFGLKIYPNPAQDFINVSCSDFKNAQIYNLKGQLLLQSNEQTIDISNLPKGSYLLKVKNKLSVTVTEKFIK